MTPFARNARIAVIPALLLAGCSLAPRTELPAPPIPVSWPAGDAYLSQQQSSLPEVTYEDVFTDPRLQRLIAQALDNNRDLRTAWANVEAARAQVRVQRANQFPELGVIGSATYAETGSTNVGAGTVASSREGWTFSAQGGVSAFELDLFGRLRNATEAQRQTAFATEAAARTVRLTLVADLALAWAQVAADSELLEIARQTERNAADSVRLTRARLEGGIAPRTDLAQAQQILETARGDLALQTTALAQDVNAIRLLVGSEFDRGLLPANLAEVTRSLAVLPAGTSSQVLLRRPDVLEAEYRLRAADADIGAARAALFPTISLTGLAGFASDALSALFDGDQFRWSGGGDASYSIFNAGGRRAGVAVTEAQRDAALATYEGTIQTAFREVADALADQGTLAERLRAAGANTAAAADAARLTEASYRGGVTSFLESLVAQRSLYTARRSEVAVRLAEAANRVTLYRVLGGDQASDPAPAPAS